jgi:hypothetical protein
MGPTLSTKMFLSWGTMTQHGTVSSCHRLYTTHNLERISPFFEKIPNSMQLVINTSNAELHVQDIDRFRLVTFDEGLL